MHRSFQGSTTHVQALASTSRPRLSEKLFATADVESLIADDCPIDEYDPEAKHFYDLTMGWKPEQFTAERILPLLIRLFEEQFPNGRSGGLAKQKALAQQIARFFGPEARPQVRNA